MRLARIVLSVQFRALEKQLAGETRLALAWRPFGDAESLREDLLSAIAAQSCLAGEALPRTSAAFDALLVRARVRLRPVTDGFLRTLAQILAQYEGLAPRVARLTGPAGKDMQQQLQALVWPGLLREIPWPVLQHVPRYLAAMQWRLDKMPERAGQDARHTAQLARWTALYQSRLMEMRKAGRTDPRLEDFRWLMEELRVSLFAQQLKTTQPVSFKRLEKLWNETG